MDTYPSTMVSYLLMKWGISSENAFAVRVRIGFDVGEGAGERIPRMDYTSRPMHSITILSVPNP